MVLETPAGYLLAAFVTLTVTWAREDAADHIVPRLWRLRLARSLPDPAGIHGVVTWGFSTCCQGVQAAGSCGSEDCRPKDLSVGPEPPASLTPGLSCISCKSSLSFF